MGGEGQVDMTRLVGARRGKFGVVRFWKEMNMSALVVVSSHCERKNILRPRILRQELTVQSH